MKTRQSDPDFVEATSITSPDVSTHFRPGAEVSPWGRTYAGSPLYAISRSNWSPGSAEASCFLETASKGDSGFGRNWIAMKVTAGLKDMKPTNVRTLILAIQAPLITALFLLCPDLVQAAGEVGADYVVFKNVRSIQTNVGTFGDPGATPYRFDVLVQAASNGSITGGTVSLPAGSSATSPQTLVLQNDGVINDGTYAFQQNFADQPTLDSNYTDGTYGLQ